MRRRIEPVDLMVAVGVFATVLGGYFLFLVTNGTLEAGVSIGAPIEQNAVSLMPTDAMEWVQPVLGQAIVEETLLEFHATQDISQAAAELNRASLLSQSLAASPFAYIERIQRHAAEVEADHEARVQYVLGRFIVAFTSRGVRTGLLLPELLDGPYNRHMIQAGENTRIRMNSEYREMREPLLGWSIVAASQGHQKLMEQAQHRLGAAIVRVAQVQGKYRRGLEALQEQLASVAIASIQAEEIADRFEALASADRSGQQPAREMEARSWPEVSPGLLLSSMGALIALFCALFLVPSARPEEAAELPAIGEERLPEAAAPRYRKTA